MDASASAKPIEPKKVSGRSVRVEFEDRPENAKAIARGAGRGGVVSGTARRGGWVEAGNKGFNDAVKDSAIKVVATTLRHHDAALCRSRQNLQFGVPTLGLAKRIKAKIFQASTSEVYGDPHVHPQPESYWGHVNPLGLRACYDEGKRAAETLFFDYHRQHRVRIKVARIFNTYGPRMHPHDGRVVSNFIMQALRGEPITIYGDGTQTRSFGFVDDLIAGVLKLMSTEDGFLGPVNLGNPNEVSVRELAELVIAMTGSRSQLVFKTLPSDDPKQRQPDISLARAKLGWEPKVDLRDGLQRTIDYFKSIN